MDNHLVTILGQHEFKYATGELTQVSVRQIGLGSRSVRIAGLPPEVNDNAIIMEMARYGEIQSIKDKYGQIITHTRSEEESDI
jgi:hypothetical protein